MILKLIDTNTGEWQTVDIADWHQLLQRAKAAGWIAPRRLWPSSSWSHRFRYREIAPIEKANLTFAVEAYHQGEVGHPYLGYDDDVTHAQLFLQEASRVQLRVYVPHAEHA